QLVAAFGRKKVEARELMAKAEGDMAVLQAKEEVAKKAEAFLNTRFPEVLFAGANVNKTERRNALARLRAELDAALQNEGADEMLRKHAAHIFEDIVEAAVTRAILERGERVGGRSLTEIRTLTSDVALLPRVHGSGLFSRGDTQVLSVATLGAPGDVQILDGMEEVGKK